MSLQKAIEHFSERIQKSELKIEDGKQIPYGKQFYVRSNEDKLPVNIYYSKKKGISYIIGGSNQHLLKQKIQSILGLKIAEPFVKPNWDCWLGTDESGKGDFFGPLVCAGFVCKKVMVDQLTRLGVKDSKLLKDTEIAQIARIIMSRFSPFYEVIVLYPHKYNELYKHFSNQQKKLNELLAWMHARILKNSYTIHHFQGILIDKFTSKKVIMQSLNDLPKIDIVLQEKAEQDVAVAAASILARYHFLQGMKRLNEKFEVKFPKGANQNVIRVAQEFANQNGKEALNQVAKTHFKTFQEIKEKV